MLLSSKIVNQSKPIMRLMFCNERKYFDCANDEITKVAINKRSANSPNSFNNFSIGLTPKLF